MKASACLLAHNGHKDDNKLLLCASKSIGEACFGLLWSKD